MVDHNVIINELQAINNFLWIYIPNWVGVGRVPWVEWLFNTYDAEKKKKWKYILIGGQTVISEVMIPNLIFNASPNWRALIIIWQMLQRGQPQMSFNMFNWYIICINQASNYCISQFTRFPVQGSLIGIN